MEELKVANGESFNRQVEIKILPFVLAGERERRAITIKRILAHKTAERNHRINQVKIAAFICNVVVCILSILSLMTSYLFIIPALVSLGYIALFEYANPEVTK
jgi:hypothetical protein